MCGSTESVLDADWLTMPKHAQLVINRLLRRYNHARSYQARNMCPPALENL